MKKFLIVTGSVTYALRAKDILRRYGYSADVKKVQKMNQNMGCGYGVFTEGDIAKIEKLLQNNGVKILFIEAVTK